MSHGGFSVSTPRILIVEDEAIIARDLRMLLESFDFTVTGVAASALEAFQKIEQSPPDLVLMDIRIKGDMDGIYAAGVVRTRYGLPVIYLSAHADDETLRRAQTTEPFGYLVKPLGNMNIKAMVTMAIHKHRAERQLQDSRTLLFTILQGLPSAVLVANEKSELLFLNLAAEELTGWTLQEALGKNLFEVAAIQDQQRRVVSPELLVRANTEGKPLPLPRNSVLKTKSGKAVEISGQLSVTKVDQNAMGVFLSLFDVARHKSEERRISQELQMFVASELAHGVAMEFYSLFDYIQEAANAVRTVSEDPEITRIQQASRIGAGMSRQLIDLREGHGEPHFVNVRLFMQSSKDLLQHICGTGVQLEFLAIPEVGFVFCTGNHFEQLFFNLILEGKQRLGGAPGRLQLRAEIHSEPDPLQRVDSYVRFLLRAEKTTTPDAVEDLSTFGPESAELGIALVRTIALASQGYTKVMEISENVTQIEVLLPRHESPNERLLSTNPHPQIVLLIGFQTRFSESLRHSLADEVSVLEANSLPEADLMTELYRGNIDVAVLNESRFLPAAAAVACARIEVHRPDLRILKMASPDALSGNDPLNAGELVRRVKEFFHQRGKSAGA